MPEYLSPGVYVEEIEIGGKPIEGVSTSTAGFLGETERGPTIPGLVTSWLEFQRVFGGYCGADKYLPYTVQGFFENGGQRCYIGRIVKASSQTAWLKLQKETENVLTVAAVGEGAWGNRVAVKITPGTFGGFRVGLFYWNQAPQNLFDPETDNVSTPRPSLTEVFDNLTVNENSPDYYEKRINGISNLVRWSLAAGDSGAMPDTGHSGTARGGGEGTVTLAAGASGIDDAYKGMCLEITGGTGSGQVRKVTDYDGAAGVATVDSDWTIVPDITSTYRVYLLAYLGDGLDSLVWQGSVMDAGAGNITLDEGAAATDDAYQGMCLEITGGTGKGQVRAVSDYDGADRVVTLDLEWEIIPDDTSAYRIIDLAPELVLGDYERFDTNEPGKRKGLSGFAEVDEISIIYTPNALAVDGLAGALITHCESLKDRFAIIDAAQSSANISALNPRNSNDSKYAAFYYPWLKVVDSGVGLLRLCPPGGHVAGIYARSDTERGVHKAPANEIVRGAMDLEFQITKGEQDVLNPRGVNCIRAFPGRGIRVWGARTLSSDPLWKYINVRRLFLFMEESIEEGTQWVVFEPNNERLWARVKRTITEFLTRVWRDGALMGAKPEEAFFVKADRTTMTQDDIDNGRLIVLIGVAPVKPAEFVIFRIAQVAGGSDITEI
ncbi:phage tail sheath family protein [Phosphitispora fastidiosa]|uniref:phage tail sheath family protein n=1 Tax=Phosphitispora fastidiosa TaxID=2837202 RepID=UPI001E55EDD9|nr:phage tail sheath family protein [Phosphitispora fastidiosa]MBU7005780.1 phage tail sheath protein FI [Phosphitispora fastidiosa]